MTIEDKEKVVDEIISKYISKESKINADKVASLINEFSDHDLRGTLIIGAAYIEELCKECFLLTLYPKCRKKFDKEMRRELTFSMTSNLLWAQGYLSNDIFELISIVRDIRNKLAHNAILNESHSDTIEIKARRIEEILQGIGLTFNPDFNKDNYDFLAGIKIDFKTKKSPVIEKINNTKKTYLTAVADLIVGLSVLRMWIIPDEKLAYFHISETQKKISVEIYTELFSEYSLENFKNRYEN